MTSLVETLKNSEKSLNIPLVQCDTALSLLIEKIYSLDAKDTTAYYSVEAARLLASITTECPESRNLYLEKGGIYEVLLQGQFSLYQE